MRKKEKNKKIREGEEEFKEDQRYGIISMVLGMEF